MASMSPLLEGVEAKLDRANEILGCLEKESFKYFSQDPPVVRLEHKNTNNEYAFIAYGEPNPPLRFSIMAGEIVHHLRSSLDHLITALVIRNGVEPTYQHQFPICTSEDDFQRACKKGQIRGISESAKKLIRSVQPFTTPTPSNTILNVITKYDNADKHRLLVVVTAIAHLNDVITIGINHSIAKSLGREGKPPAIVGVEMGAQKISVDGVAVFKLKFEEPAPEYQIDDTGLLPQLAFEKCGSLENAPVIPMLRAMIEGTLHTIRLFDNEF